VEDPVDGRVGINDSNNEEPTQSSKNSRRSITVERIIVFIMWDL